MRITFIGATEEVTGSLTLIEHNNQLGLVDCGLYQGGEETVEKNLQKLPFKASALKQIVLTHAHLDHSGYLPALVRKGFRGQIICTNATAKLAKIILTDSASLNEKSHSPLYDSNDVKQTNKLFHITSWDNAFSFLGMPAKLMPAGHILGASSLIVEGDKRVVFSGDLGRQDDYLMPAPPPCPSSDIVIMESTYGARQRTGAMEEDMLNFLKKVKDEKMVGIIASFALARGQVLLTMIEELFRQKPELRVPLVFDSPMMKEVNQVYRRQQKLTKRPLELERALTEAESVDYIGQWETLSRKDGPLVIVSSSGMVSGGRIFRSLSNWQTETEAILFLVGYQGENTPGRALLEGQRIIHDNEGNPIVWRGEVYCSEAFSSHADQTELIEWVKESKAEKIFLIHGDATAKQALKEALEEMGSFQVILPSRHESFEL